MVVKPLSGFLDGSSFKTLRQYIIMDYFDGKIVSFKFRCLPLLNLSDLMLISSNYNLANNLALSFSESVFSKEFRSSNFK